MTARVRPVRTTATDMRPALALAKASIAVTPIAAACGGSTGSALPQGADPVELDPADFTTEIDNPYWPMSPGSNA